MICFVITFTAFESVQITFIPLKHFNKQYFIICCGLFFLCMIIRNTKRDVKVPSLLLTYDYSFSYFLLVAKYAILHL